MSWREWVADRFLQVRAASGDDYTTWLVAQAAGGSGILSTDVTKTGALETAASLYARCLSQAEVEPDDPRTRAITPDVLAEIGRECIRKGEWLAEISLNGIRVKLTPVTEWEVRGSSPDPETWRVLVTQSTPDGSRDKFVPYMKCVHVRYSTSPRSPWSGSPPWALSKETARLLAALETRLADEAGGPVAHIVPVVGGVSVKKPGNGGTDRYSDPDAEIKAARGKPVLVESTRTGATLNRAAIPQDDWKPRRVGANPPESVVELRRDAEKSILRSCGIPEALYESSGATSGQQAWRQFLHATLIPFVLRVQGQLRESLDLPELRLKMTRLTRTDVAHQSRVVSGLVKANVPLEQAMRIAGLDDA